MASTQAVGLGWLNSATPKPSEHLAAGCEALDRAAWEEARASFEQALGESETPEAYEGLGWAAWWLEDAETTFHAKERAYGLYRERGDRAPAARVAVWLAIDTLTFRGEPAVATGWLQRAARLLEGLAACREHALLTWYQGHFSVWSDADRALELARFTQELGRSLHLSDFELVGIGLEGLAHVLRGEAEEGMRLLDESIAGVVAGELRDPTIAAGACCYLIVACDRLRDVGRAAQWCKYLEELARRWRYRHMFALCQTYYAGVLLEQGRWDECERVLRQATEELKTTRPALVGGALARLGELRRRQGRLAEAEELWSRAAHESSAQLGRAALALDRGDPEEAAELAQRCLRSVQDRDATARFPALELLVAAAAACRRFQEADTALIELRTTARAVGTDALAGSVALCEGLVAISAGDAASAVARFEDSVDLFAKSGLRYQASFARLQLARALAQVGRADDAGREAQQAKEELESMGASLLATHASVAPSTRVGENGARLTDRELEVLRLVADGLSNKQIAARLVLSEHTVRRHVSNIRAKLSAPSRAGAAAQGLRRGLI